LRRRGDVLSFAGVRFPPGLFTLALAAVAAAAGLACAGHQLPAQQITSPGEALFNGRVKPDVDCYKCHDGDATGSTWGPNLGKRVPKLTDQQIAKAILEGPFTMPSFKGKVTDADIAAITAWLRQRFPS
jgi:mono/diheme cytochrome c family protein